MSQKSSTTEPRSRLRRRQIIAGLGAIALSIGATTFADSSASAGRSGNPNPPGNPDPPASSSMSSCWASTTTTAISRRITPGTVDRRARRWCRVPVGEAQRAARRGSKYSLTVAAGDLIGGSPAFSGLFHDEPSVESLNAMQLDVSSVGNHEFDEGVTELLRMQNGGCHPVDGCYFPSEPYAGADFQWLAANVVETTPARRRCRRTGSSEVQERQGRLHRHDARGDRHPGRRSRHPGLGLPRRGRDRQRARARSCRTQGVEAIVVLLHEGGSQTPPPGDVDACVGISGPIVAINDALDPAIDAMITGHTHLPYNCVLDRRRGQARAS